MPPGKFFFIRHVTSGLILQVDAKLQDRVGAEAKTGFQLQILEARDHQLWYLDQSTCTIRNKLCDLCMDLRDDKVVLHPFQRRNSHQRWQLRGSRIQNKDENDIVLGLMDNNPVEGQNVLAMDSDGSETQQWDLDHTQAEYFYIRSQANDRVLEVCGGDDSTGIKAVLSTTRGQHSDHQLWYENERGVILSKLTGYAFTSCEKQQSMAAPVMNLVQRGVSTEDEVFMEPYDYENDRQQWIISENTIRNRADPEEVLTFKGGGWFSNPFLIVSDYNAGSNQLWLFDYIPNQIVSLSHPGTGRYVRIQSRSSGHHLTIKDGSPDPGTDVVLWDRKSSTHEANDQLWYVDEQSGTIRSALHDYCLDLNDTRLIVNPFSVESRSQQWKVNGMKIYCATQPDKALQVENDNKEIGARVTITMFRSILSQLWEVQNVPARCFFIKSFACPKIIGVKDHCRDSGGQVAIYNKDPDVIASQLWYEDENGYIRSRLNGYVLDSSEDSFLKLRPYVAGKVEQQWTVVEDSIQNTRDHNLVLDIRRGWTWMEGIAIVAFQKNDKDHQRWYCEYLE